MQHNFTIVHDDNKLIQAKVLSLSKDNIHSLMCNFQCNNTGFDAVSNCDCVYEPLRVKSNELLVDFMNELLIINLKCVVITISERRNSEVTYIFLDMMQLLDSVSKVEKFILMRSM